MIGGPLCIVLLARQVTANIPVKEKKKKRKKRSEQVDLVEPGPWESEIFCGMWQWWWMMSLSRIVEELELEKVWSRT